MGNDSNKEIIPPSGDSPRLARDIFLGPDVSKGREILGLLESEGIGVQVRRRATDEKKVMHMFDRNPGEEDIIERPNRRQTVGNYLSFGN